MIDVKTRIERWEPLEPFTTARDRLTHVSVLVAQLTDSKGLHGWAEAMGVDYDGETPESIAAEIEAVKPTLHEDISGEELLDPLRAGGARNALDCALWDLRAKQSGRPASLLAQLCTFTDLDGPLLQKLDRSLPIRFESGWMQPPHPELWG